MSGGNRVVVTDRDKHLLTRVRNSLQPPKQWNRGHRYIYLICFRCDRIFGDGLKNDSELSPSSSSRSSSPFDIITLEDLEPPKLDIFRDKFGLQLSLDQAVAVSQLVEKEDLAFSFREIEAWTSGKVWQVTSSLKLCIFNSSVACTIKGLGS